MVSIRKIGKGKYWLALCWTEHSWAFITNKRIVFGRVFSDYVFNNRVIYSERRVE